MTGKSTGTRGAGNKSSRASVTAPDAELPENWNYEATVAQVERTISQIESGALELAEVFDQFAAATEYLRQCESFLAQRQRQMDVLIENLGNEPNSF